MTASVTFDELALIVAEELVNVIGSPNRIAPHIVNQVADTFEYSCKGLS
ncbi:hypothetical protein [Nocardia inohanensis]|nr:hypothetical protein [Nocardia inohanensis]